MSIATIARTDIPMMSASQMAAAIRAGDLTPLEIVEALLERIAAHDGKIKSFSYLDRETVLIEAETLTKEAKDGNFRGPLHGVPFGVKEQFLVGGVPTLGDHVQVACHVCILGPVTVGDRAKIGAGAVVISDIPADATAVGVPAKAIQKKSSTNEHELPRMEEKTPVPGNANSPL